LRYLPKIDYGTERYSAKVARRLRILNIATWMAATLMGSFALSEFLFASEEGRQVGIAYVIAAAVLASIPLLHRFGPLVGPLAFAVVGYAIIFIICSMVGTDTGMPMQYLVAAAIVVLILGADHPVISASFTLLSAFLIIALELTV
jgi:adenylate cyclase